MKSRKMFHRVKLKKRNYSHKLKHLIKYTLVFVCTLINILPVFSLKKVFTAAQNNKISRILSLLCPSGVARSQPELPRVSLESL
jgi:hypothetical protein